MEIKTHAFEINKLETTNPPLLIENMLIRLLDINSSEIDREVLTDDFGER